MPVFFAKLVAGGAVNSATFCLIATDASRRPAIKPEYHDPISFQLEMPDPLPPDGINATTILPAIPRHGGI